ncbi:hypothetical protein BVRB_3g050830 [Beta vulgaris subsp. vulgaris]|uniref:Uncharacterized protein n=1 Tax=Beta vulgaris subsp. vulgaris TaxID=3555 RepID=A0A0J8CWX8_BETVV|nr:hypothetical protein BVRB_3g050830 [Beta vulgaris subsp. vulgaris]
MLPDTITLEIKSRLHHCIISHLHTKFSQRTNLSK